MAQVDYFLKLDGVKGESTDSKHKEEIDLESWSWGVTQSGTSGFGAGAGAGKAVSQDFHFTKRFDKASPVLFITCTTGKHFKDAVLTARKAGEGQQEYLKITLSDAIVSSYQVGGSEGSGVVPSDQFSLNFSKVEFSYKPQKSDGSLDAEVKQTYDFSKNVKG
jgi:type VI secretion system secreted protein Hcp